MSSSKPPSFARHRSLFLQRRTLACGLALFTLGSLASAFASALQEPSPTETTQLVTGKSLSPQGAQESVGSFPTNIALSPDGRYILVTDAGSLESVSVLRASDGKVVSRLDWNADSPIFKGKKQALYYGLVCGQPQNGRTPVYVSRGAEGTVSVLSLDSSGTLTDTGRRLGAQAGTDPKLALTHLAGLALSSDGRRLYAADNSADPTHNLRGALQILDVGTGAVLSKVDLPGYSFAVAATTQGEARGKIYVTSEQRGVVSVVEAASGRVLRQIATGTQPVGLLLDRAQNRLFVANAGSDTVSIIDTRRDAVTHTLLMRPDNMRGLPGATPTGLALSPDEKRLYVTLADMNAVAVVKLPKATLEGYLPVGWYPTATTLSPDGKRLFVANAKGVKVRNPNDKPVPGIPTRPQYVQNIIQGTVSTIDLARVRRLKPLTAQVLANNQGQSRTDTPFANPGIKHVFYIIKENRTYDQVLGDLPRGNGDLSQVLFGREVTPNQHALAERFALLDNFYCCAEVSGDGWNWSTGGMASEYTERNVAHNYGSRQRPYDFEGTNNGVAVDRLGSPDAARPPGGYIWDLCASHGVSMRNYGFFTDDLELPRTTAEEGTPGRGTTSTKRALAGSTDSNFRQFDTAYADSEAWVQYGLIPTPKQRTTHGAFQDPSRVTAWKREFAEYVKNGNLPAFSMLRLMRDHTAGTTEGASSPRAMVADNDYAVGQVVETISHSPYWVSSAIVIVEDDAQNGYDHVDAHRSTAYVVSPFVEQGRHDSRFYNTDSALRTIELLLGLPPMNSYDAIAAPLSVFGKTATNLEPFTAILPPRAIVAEVNTKAAYRAQDSARLLNPVREESAPDEELNDILWHSIKGSVAPPPRHYTMTIKTRDADDDDD